MITNGAHDTTAAAELTSSLLSNYACDVHPQHSTAAVPAKRPKAVTALVLERNASTPLLILHYYEYRITLHVIFLWLSLAPWPRGRGRASTQYSTL